MAAITTDLAFTASHPMLRTALADEVVAYNSADGGNLTITVGKDYRRLKIKNMTCNSSSPATTPAFAEEERVIATLRRGGSQSTGGDLTSRKSCIVFTSSRVSQQWMWRPEDLNTWPEILPGDTIILTFPAIDDSGTPTADLRYTITFDVRAF